MDMALVKWIDSCEPVPNAEIEKHDLPVPLQIESVGWIVENTKKHVTVAGAYKPDHSTFDYVITIPKVAVKSITKLATQRRTRSS